jgi:alkylated DNA repair dioxygenase AlkB
MDRLFLQRISELSVAQLDRIVLRLSQEITSRKTKTSNSRTLDPQDFVNYEENFLNCTDVELLKGEVEQLKGQGRRKGKPHNTWISNTGLVYGWDEKSLEPHDLTNYPCVAATLKRINDEHGYNLNSCLVTYYPGEQGVGYHSDFELSLEDGAPIVVLSLGEPRKVDFNWYSADLRGTAPFSIHPSEGSIYTMKGGCQEAFKHRVPNARGCSGRFALSFRRMNETTVPTHTEVKTPPPPPPPPRLNNAPVLPSPPSQDQEVSVLLGTSLTKWIPSGPGFVNLSTSGARLTSPHPDWRGRTAHEILEEFRRTEPDIKVGKIIIAFGTNDLRYLRGKQGNPPCMKHLESPMRALIKESRNMFKNANIFVAHLIPMRPEHRFTVGNVWNFNNIISRICFEMGCNTLFWTNEFLIRAKQSNMLYINNRLFCKDGIHLNRFGYMVAKKLVYSVI